MLEEGQIIVHRGLHPDGRVGTVECARVLRDDADALVTWIGRGYAAIRRTTLDGEPVRYLALDQKLSLPTVPGLSAWRGPGVVIVTPPEARHAIWWFFDEQGQFDSWYINLQSPAPPVVGRQRYPRSRARRHRRR